MDFLDKIRPMWSKSSVRLGVWAMRYQCTILPLCLLLFASVLLGCSVMSKRIDCTPTGNVWDAVMVTHCSSTSIYVKATAWPREMNWSNCENRTLCRTTLAVKPGQVLPGVHPGKLSNDEVKVTLGWYSWTPLWLMICAFLFHLPLALLKVVDGGRIKAATGRLEYMPQQTKLSRKQAVRAPAVKGSKYDADKHRRRDREGIIHDFWASHARSSSTYGVLFIVTEITTSFMLALAIGTTTLTFGIRILTYGSDVLRFATGKWLRDDQVFPIYPGTDLFPPAALCEATPFGTLQIIQSVCILPLNYVHQIIFLVLWFQSIVLIVFNGLMVLSRALTFVSVNYRAWLIYSIVGRDLNTAQNFCKTTSALQFVLAYQLFLNSDPLVALRLMQQINKNQSRPGKYV